MKKLLRNTISILLLVFYLTGFCGLNLLKHSCFACNQDDFHVIYDLDKFADEIHICKADSHSHCIQTNHDSPCAHYGEIPCCTLELIYLKNSPDTLIEQIVKSPLVSSQDLFVCAYLLQIDYSSYEEVHGDCLQKIINPPEITQDLLCCYRC